MGMPREDRSLADRRFDWEQMRRYWERNQELRGQTDFGEDPHALGNVCTIGAPTWLNEHYARGQTAVFERLLARVPRAPGRALDVGCGAARWTQRLAALGWEATGIDLQESLIAHNRRQLPHIHFEQVALQEFQSDMPFSLISSVTVLGHIPHQDQPEAVEKLHSLTVPGSRVLLLENIRDQSAHVFANSIAGWRDRFLQGGFRCEAVVPYDFNPCLRAVAQVRRVVARIGRHSRPEPPPQPDEHLALTPERSPSALVHAYERLYQIILALAGAGDRHLDPWLTQLAVTRPPPVHAGMLFVRT